MPFEECDGIRLFTFDLFRDAALTHAAFARQGGVSPSPWDSLNVGGTVGDDPARVRENRKRALNVLGRNLESTFDVWQVHSADVVIAESPRLPQPPYPQADAILTDRPEVTLFMRFADCVPILLHDPVRKVIGLVHAGWMGTVKGAVTAAVQAMQDRYGSQPGDLLAGIGPAIGPDHYEIGADVVTRVQQTFGQDAAGLLRNQDERTHFDLWAANRLLLEQAGVHQIEIAGLCTACAVGDWFSHRAAKGRTGRFGVLIAL